ncbi:MAG: glycosyltransferase family 39 protein [Acidobacteriia bacterium]|nr:glycosyltransferase family 39 protein [Terriglobia bacterium]
MLNRPSRMILLTLGFVVIILLFFLRLDAMGLTGPDEPRYAEVAKEMFQSHDYITPRLLGQPWFEKPVLYYWLAASAYSIGGVNETAARLPSAAAAFLLTLTLFLGTRPILNFETRWLSSIIFGTSLGTIAFSRAASTDMLLTATFSIAMILFWVTLLDRSPTPSVPRVALAYLSLGLSVLAKGPVGIVLAMAILFCYFWISGRWAEIKRLQIPLGIVLLAAVDLPWFLLCFRANGWAFIDTFLIHHNLLRFTTNEFQHGRPLWFYVPVIVGALLPWTFLLLLPGGRCRELFNRDAWRNHPQRVILGVWVVIPFLFFTIARSKLPGYILPVLIPLSILLGISLFSASRQSPDAGSPKNGRWCLLGALGLEGLFFTCLLIFSHRIASRFGLTLSGLDWTLGVTAALMIVMLIGSFFHRLGLLIAVGSHVLLVTVLVIISALSFLPRLDSEISARPAAQAILQVVKSPRVFVLDVPRSARYGLDFYLTPPPVPATSIEEVFRHGSEDIVFLVLPSRTSNRHGADASQVAGDLIYQSRDIKVLKIKPHPE